MQATHHPLEKNQSRFQKPSQKEQEGNQGHFLQLSQHQYTYKSSLEQSKAIERQKKINILEVNGAQYKHSKRIANKIGDRQPSRTILSTKLRL